MSILRAIYIMWLRDLLRLKRDTPRLAASLGQPVLWLLLIGSGLSSAMRLGSAAGPAGVDFDYMKFMFPGVLGMSLLFTSMFSAMSIAWDREFGFLKEILVAPVPRWAIAVGKTLGCSTVAVVQGALMLVLAPFLGLSLTVEMILQIIPLMFLVSFSISAMGIAIASGVKSMEAFQMISQFIMMPLFMLSGAVFPLRNLPDWMNVLVQVNPVSYGVDMVRQVILLPTLPASALAIVNFNTIQVDMLVVGAFGVVMLLVGVRQFSLQT